LRSSLEHRDDLVKIRTQTVNRGADQVSPLTVLGASWAPIKPLNYVSASDPLCCRQVAEPWWWTWSARRRGALTASEILGPVGNIKATWPRHGLSRSGDFRPSRDGADPNSAEHPGRTWYGGHFVKGAGESRLDGGWAASFDWARGGRRRSLLTTVVSGW